MNTQISPTQSAVPGHTAARAAGEAGLLQLVTFRAGGEEFGVEILTVKEIIRLVEITRLPHAPDFVEGIINLRGQVIPIIDLRSRMGMPVQPADSHTRIIVVELEGRTTGFIVDSVSEVLRLPGDTVEPAPDWGGDRAEFLHGVGRLGDRLLLLVDLGKILGRGEQRALEAIQ